MSGDKKDAKVVRAGLASAAPHKHRYALTLGEQAEIRVGSTLTGNGLAKRGFSVRELRAIANSLGGCDFRVLSDVLDKKHAAGNEAAVLLIKRGVDRIMGREGGADEMLAEQKAVKYDEKYFDPRRQKTLTNRARLNVVFGEKSVPHAENYSHGTIVGWDCVPRFSELRKTLPSVLGEIAAGLNGEGNFYHHGDAGIGYHGDGERKIVVGTCLGKTATLRFYWRAPHSSTAHKPPFDFVVEHGDIYIMSEKASGFDWKMRSRFRLVHAAGAKKYLAFTPGYKDAVAKQVAGVPEPVYSLSDADVDEVLDGENA
jgi:hypothetical protein